MCPHVHDDLTFGQRPAKDLNDDRVHAGRRQLSSRPSRTCHASLRSKRFRGVWEQRTGFLVLCPRGKWGESQKWNMGVGKGKEGTACRQTPGFWKPPFASERSSWLAELVENYWQVSIKGLFLSGCQRGEIDMFTKSVHFSRRTTILSWASTIRQKSCSVFRSLHIIAEASSTQFAAVPWILTSTAFVNTTCAKNKIILKTTGQKTHT